jgi:hypothetical protein
MQPLKGEFMRLLTLVIEVLFLSILSVLAVAGQTPAPPQLTFSNIAGFFPMLLGEIVGSYTTASSKSYGYEAK